MNVISIERARQRHHIRREEEARTAFIERDFARALELARDATRYGSGCAHAQILLGDILCALGRELEALLAYHRARRLARSEAEPYWSVSTVHFLRGRFKDALRYLEQADEHVGRGDGLLQEWIAEDRATCLLRLGRRAEALDVVRQALERRPRGKRLQELRAELTQGRRRSRPLPGRSDRSRTR